MAEMRYEPDAHGTGMLLRSEPMRRFMAQIGNQAAAIAKSHAGSPDTITTTTVVSFGRWCANITNSADNAFREEYGAKFTPARAPLGHVINQVRAADPNRHKGPLTRVHDR